MKNADKNKLIDEICKVCDKYGLLIKDGEMVEEIQDMVESLLSFRDVQ